MSEKKIEKVEYFFVRIPQEFIDDMANISSNSVKLYLVLFRLTNDGKAWPSNAELLELTGIKHKQTLSDAIMDLVKRGWIGNITNPSEYNHQSQYYVNTKRMVNQDLVNKKVSKHESMSEKKKDEWKQRKLLNSSSTEIDSSSTEISTSASTENSTRKRELNNKDLIFCSKTEQKNFFNYPDKTAWLLEAMFEAGVFKSTPPMKEDNLPAYKKWVAQLNILVNAGSKEEILESIPRCLFRDFRIDEPIAISERLNAHISKARILKDDENKRWNFGTNLAEVKNDEEIHYAPMPKSLFSKSKSQDYFVSL